MVQRGEIIVKKVDFGVKKGGIGLEKSRADSQTRKANWCKMQVFFMKMDKTKGVKDQKWWLFTYFLTRFFARTS